MNARRNFLLGLVAMSATLVRAQSPRQSPKAKRVGILRTGVAGAGPQRLAKVFIDTMRELGWVEGRNIIYDFASAEGDESRLAEVAEALVARRPDLISVANTPQARAAYSKTRTIPIVFSAVNDPVEVGLVQSLARPGGNITGIANIGWELGGKRVQLLKELMPKIRRVGVLMTGGRSPEQEAKLIEETVGAGVMMVRAVAQKAAELDAAFALFTQGRAEALILTQTALFMRERKRILANAAKYRIPVIAYRSEQADDGALLSYGSLLSDLVRRSAQLADRILRGAKPADIPVEQPVKFELVINMKTANALGIMIPQSLLAQAERVIE